MAKRPRISVTSENATGRNETFRDNVTGNVMSASQFVNQIERGSYPDYHIRNINGIKTPVSNPDKNKSNNLG